MTPPSEHPSGLDNRPRRVLVLGDDTRSFLTIVRSFGRQGIEVEVAPVNFASPALRSRYVRRIHRLPVYTGDGEEWIVATSRLIAERRFELVIPCDDRSILPFHAHRDRFTGQTVVGIPNPASVEVLFNKEKTKALAAEHGVRLAGTMPLQGADPAAVLARLGSPLVVKPKQSYRMGALHRRAAVRIVDSVSELAQAMDEMGATECYAEEFFQGTGVGVSVLANRGGLLAAFQHHRVHEPTRGAGASSFRVSAPLSPEMVKACGDMLGALAYTGVAMFEFRRNFRTGDWILLEVNARPWGSMPLPVSLGVDFPYRWYRLLVEGDASPHDGYRTGVYGRNLVLDIQFLIGEIAAARGRGGAKLRIFGSWLLSFRHLLAGHERSDTITSDDRRPGWVELRQLGQELVTKVGRRLPFAHAVLRARARARLRAALRAAARRGEALRLVVVCYGNICRSPFAERLLARRLAESGDKIACMSAGTYSVVGRPSPEVGVDMARRFEIELDNHRSRYLTDEMAQSATAILVFDNSNVEAIAQRFPELSNRIIRLGLLVPDSDMPWSIDDPYGGDEQSYERAYRHIAAAVDGLYALIAKEAW